MFGSRPEKGTSCGALGKHAACGGEPNPKSNYVTKLRRMKEGKSPTDASKNLGAVVYVPAGACSSEEEAQRRA